MFSLAIIYQSFGNNTVADRVEKLGACGPHASCIGLNMFLASSQLTMRCHLQLCRIGGVSPEIRHGRPERLTKGISRTSARQYDQQGQATLSPERNPQFFLEYP
jgi:hypothetical protein